MVPGTWNQWPASLEDKGYPQKHHPNLGTSETSVPSMMKDQDIKYSFFLDENWIDGHGIKKKLNCSEHGLIWVYYKTVITAIRSVPCGLLLLENQGWDSSLSLTVPHKVATC